VLGAFIFSSTNLPSPPIHRLLLPLHRAASMNICRVDAGPACLPPPSPPSLTLGNGITSPTAANGGGGNEKVEVGLFLLPWVVPFSFLF
jgi:hypothetical protein